MALSILLGSPLRGAVTQSVTERSFPKPSNTVHAKTEVNGPAVAPLLPTAYSLLPTPYSLTPFRRALHGGTPAELCVLLNYRSISSMMKHSMTSFSLTSLYFSMPMPHS